MSMRRSYHDHQWSAVIGEDVIWQHKIKLEDGEHQTHYIDAPETDVAVDRDEL
jgi:hypothetical protein